MEGIDEEVRAGSEAVAQEDYREADVEKKEKTLRTYQRRHRSMNSQQLDVPLVVNVRLVINILSLLNRSKLFSQLGG